MPKRDYRDAPSVCARALVFYKMGENLQLFEMDKEERVCRRLPNADKRRIYFGTDQLSSIMWRGLRIELTKRLTSLSGAKMVLPMLETLSQITCTHDFLHETRIHRSHTIYVTHYGGFLQPFQCHLRLKGVTGKTKKVMQRHEQFLFLVDNAHCRVRMMKWLTQLSHDVFSPREGERHVDCVFRVGQSYQTWCNKFNEGLD